MREDGDIKAATKYLLAASKTPDIDLTESYLTTRLPTLLLKYGGPDERIAVIEYLERCGHTSIDRNFGLVHQHSRSGQAICPPGINPRSPGLK